ncbi:MAG: BamA/TamA family outer membrane protein [Fidelibacterota bacterium]
MPIFKRIIPFLIVVALGQNSNRIILPEADVSVADTLRLRLADEAEFGTSFMLTTISGDSLYYQSVTIPKQIDTLVFSDSTMKPRVQEKLFQSLYLKTSQDAAEQVLSDILRRHSFLKDSSIIAFGLTRDGRLAARLDIVPQFLNTFSGFINTGRENGKIKVNGELTIHLENTWGTANRISLFWKQPNSTSRLLHFTYDEPYPVGIPIGLSFTADQEYRDENYITTRTRTDGILQSGRGYQIKMGFSRARMLATERGKVEGIRGMEESLLTLGFSWLKQDDRWLPRNGISLDGDIRAGKQKSSVTARTVKLDFGAMFHYPLSANIVTSSYLRYYLRETFGDKVPPSDYVYYGGSTTLRGYSDDLFKTTDLLLLSAELGYRRSHSRLYYFTDFGFNVANPDWKYGTGFGYQQVSKSVLISISYGIVDLRAPGEGKVHIRLENRL